MKPAKSGVNSRALKLLIDAFLAGLVLVSIGSLVSRLLD
jgi:hypothetical protein